MEVCLLQLPVTALGNIDYDYHFFYIKEGVGYCNCGVARTVFTNILCQYRKQIGSSENWLQALHHFKTNRSVLGFLVEQVCITQILNNGLLNISDQKPEQCILFTDQATIQLDQGCTLYVLLRYNHKGVDAVLLYLNREMKTAHLVPMQITITNTSKHSDSVLKFFESWSQWS